MTLNVELEITLRCNNRCPSCSRHCNIFNYEPSDMEMPDIEKFVSEVRAAGGIDILSVMGGEPTMHPHLVDILEVLNRDLYSEGLVKRFRVASNGRKKMPRLSFRPEMKISPPSKKRHRYSFIAPIDSSQRMRNCRVPYTCGVALNRFGYSPCGAGAAIARLFNLQKFIQGQMPKDPSDFTDYKKDLCSLCQAGAARQVLEGSGSTPSPSYQKAIRAFRERKDPPT